ncbi:MAG: SCO1/SenC/PrrC family cytochrome c oxidase assembly protein [Hyphomicrobiales bacterium]|nr:SCO1/SenC/PrrC family cytochrome c oxidase assembly protein [Hyphomicrobiales bacterium]
MLRRVAVTLALLLVGGVIAYVWPRPTEAASPWGNSYLPNTAVFSQENRELKFYDDLFKNKIVVVSFIYTTCRDICPVVTARLAQVQERLGADADKIHFVSVSIDPATDTPAKLRDYAEAFGITRNWTFITGKVDDLKQIRYKLGERSRKLTEHGNTILLYNDATAEWSRDSAFSDLNVLASNIRTMNPEWSAGRVEAAHATPSSQDAAPELPGQSLYMKTCASCHSIGGGDRIGPDLVGVTTRRTRDWVSNYLVDSRRMRADGDPIVLELAAKYPTVRMPSLSLSTDDATDLIGFIEAMTYARNADKRDAADAALKPVPASANGHQHHHH